jgi:LPS export ABC transporter protein LptC
MLVKNHKKAGNPGFFILALLVLVLNACENDLEKVNLITDQERIPVETSENLTILYSDSGQVKVKIKTPVLERFGGEFPITELPEGVHVSFYDDRMNENSTLTAGYAIRKDAEQIMEARHNVVVVNSKGERLNTEHLVWDEKSQKIQTQEFVKITTPDKIIHGKGFEANQDFTQYKIFQIKGTINLETDEHAANP